MVWDLDDILNDEGKVAIEYGYEDSKYMPFGGIVLDDGRIIIGKVHARREKSDHYTYGVWKTSPLGLWVVSSNGRFNMEERYHVPAVDRGELENSILDNQARIVEFIGRNKTQKQKKGTWNKWEDQRNDQIYPAMIQELERLGLTDGKVLDIGCGIGQLLYSIHQRYPNARLYGVDFIRENAQEARNTNTDADIKEGNAQRLNKIFPGMKFGFIVSNAFFEPDVLGNGSVAMEIGQYAYDMLEPGGYFIASGYSPLLTTRKVLEEIGFNVMRTVVPENLFNYFFPKQMYVAQKPVI